jgi:hypothetical protein
VGLGVKRGVAAVASVAVAAAVNVTTGMLTQHWAAAWWAATAVLVIVGGGLQLWLTAPDARSARQRVSKTKVGGSVTQRSPLAGEQSVTSSEITGDLEQSQDSGG